MMNFVGIDPVLFVRPEAQFNGLLKGEGSQRNKVNDTIIADLAILRIVKDAAGVMRFEVERAFSRGARNMPRASSINFASAFFHSTQPVRTMNGQNFKYIRNLRG